MPEFTSIADFTIKQNDTAPFIRNTLLDFEDNAVDINAATVRFIMRDLDGLIVLDEPASNDQAGVDSTGYVSYEWQEGDTDVAGAYFGEWEVTFADGEVETFPNGGNIKIWIEDDLGGLAS